MTFLTPIEGTVLNAKNLRNRVAYSAVYETAAKQTQLKNAAATYYSYDIMGNVDTLVQDFTFNNGNRFFKKVIYNYDLISGKVNSIIYQKDQPDVFYHRYTYDFANKLTNVETSTDSITWENDVFLTIMRMGRLPGW